MNVMMHLQIFGATLRTAKELFEVKIFVPFL